jgi:hypothetical protein
LQSTQTFCQAKQIFEQSYLKSVLWLWWTCSRRKRRTHYIVWSGGGQVLKSLSAFLCFGLYWPLQLWSCVMWKSHNVLSALQIWTLRSNK